MKKQILIVAALFAISFYGTAQQIAETTLGVRFGNYSSVSFQKKLSENTRLELNGGYHGYKYYSDINIEGFYHIVADVPSVENMNWYYGAGAGVGIWKYDNGWNTYYGYEENGTYFYAAGAVGIDYKFKDIPLLLSLDVRPQFVIGDFYDGLHFDGGLGIRYVFK